MDHLFDFALTVAVHVEDVIDQVYELLMLHSFVSMLGIGFAVEGYLQFLDVFDAVRVFRGFFLYLRLGREWAAIGPKGFFAKAFDPVNRLIVEDRNDVSRFNNAMTEPFKFFVDIFLGHDPRCGAVLSDQFCHLVLPLKKLC